MRILLLCLLMLFPLVCLGEVYVIRDTVTKEIYSASEKNDTVIPEGKELVTLPGNFKYYSLTDTATNHKLIDGKFILNTKKLSDEYQAKVEAEEKAIEWEMIEKKMQSLAIKELKKENKTFKYYAE